MVARHFVLVRVLWRLGVLLLCSLGNEAVRVIGCASGRVELDKSLSTRVALD